jgi:hypothetical protein
VFLAIKFTIRHHSQPFYISRGREW